MIDKVKQKTFSAYYKAKEVEEKYKVSDRVASAVATGLTKVTEKLGEAKHTRFPSFCVLLCRFGDAVFPASYFCE